MEDCKCRRARGQCQAAGHSPINRSQRERDDVVLASLDWLCGRVGCSAALLESLRLRMPSHGHGHEGRLHARSPSSRNRAEDGRA